MSVSVRCVDVRCLVRGWVSLAVAVLAGSVQAGQMSVVGMDVPALVVAEQVNPAVVQSPNMGGKLLRVKIPVSTLVSPEFTGTVSEYLLEIYCPQQSMRVVDYWPKNELYSEVAGNVSVQSTYHKDSHFSFKVSGAYEPFARGQAAGEFNERADVQQSYERKPPMQVLTAAGTAQQGFGVFFKFRPGPLPQLEGQREIAVLFEVPLQWRADMLQATMRAVGQNGSSRLVTLGEQRLWMTVHQEGDQAAAAQAQRYVVLERNLRALAASSQKQVEDQALPTVWHKMGAALEVVEPKIPQDYLSQILFSFSASASADRHKLTQATQRLPVNLRVAILDYCDQRDLLLGMAATGRTKVAKASSTTRLALQ